MPIISTGHAEIDEQHEILDALVAKLESLCAEQVQGPDSHGDDCAPEFQRESRVKIAGIVSELLTFLTGHASYEERMMELLPDTPTCQAHIKAHKAAHLGIDRQLRKLAAQIETQPPREVSLAIWRMIGDWLGDHSSLFDRRLVRMSKSVLPEFDYDSELVLMLDRHVFPNRPTAKKSSSGNGTSKQPAKMEVRARFESLSTAQKNIFFIVLGGKKNREIAEELGITLNTVKTHRAAIFSKMDVSSVVELIKKADLLR